MSALLQRWRRARSGDRAETPDPASPEVRICRALASHLLAYPDGELLGHLEMLLTAVADLPEARAELLAPLLVRLETAARDDRALRELQETYVETFDQRRRGSLYLTYFSHGDTRRRGMAMLGIKQELRDAGVILGDEELPDHLAVVLELAGTVDAERGQRILLAHRPGLELLRLHLQSIDSPWAGVVRAVCSTLPELGEDDDAAIARLIAEGPAEEDVGLAGYGAEDGPPHSAPMAWTGPVPLPNPTVRPREEGASRER
ncbi:MAG: nitrate reductase molybdenum cofactor assembly chaperone [Brachybacterium sp.]|nr:nitrate reductase molybdenum cofactor assembly chaperone [Brachybacterium sp.]